MLSHVEYSQLANSAEIQQRATNDGYYLFHVPLGGKQGELQQTALLKVYHRGERDKKLDIDNIRVVFRLDLQHLKMLEVDLLIRDRQINARISGISDDITQFISARSAELTSSLEDLGFQVNQLQYGLLGDFDEETDEDSRLLDPQYAPLIPGSVMKIDVRA